MVQFKNPLKSVKLVYCKSTALTKIVVASAIVLSMATLILLHGAINTAERNAEALRTQAIALENENNRLQQYIDDLGTVQGVLRIAQEKLGLVPPDSIVIQPE